jgi:hypothetical protein
VFWLGYDFCKKLQWTVTFEKPAMKNLLCQKQNIV